MELMATSFKRTYAPPRTAVAEPLSPQQATADSCLWQETLKRSKAGLPRSLEGDHCAFPLERQKRYDTER